MKSRARIALIVLALVGFGASVAALYVHYRLVTDPSYSSFCDVSESVSCQQVLQSEYASIGGVPVAAGGAVWSALILLLALLGMRGPDPQRVSRVAGYIAVLSTLALAAVFYFAYTSFFVLGAGCPLCMAMYVSVAGIFLVSWGAAGPVGELFANLGRDASALQRSQAGVTAAVLLLAAGIALVVFFPRAQSLEVAEGAPITQAPPAPAVEQLTPEQIAEWEKWLESQKTIPEAMPTGGAKVLLMKFNDYQCPSCRQTWALYRGVIEKWEKSHPGVFRYETRDFPLELECGVGNAGHGAACEAAVAVRLAREKNRDKEVEAALFNRQSPTMTRDEVKETLEEVAQISDFDARYPQVLEQVRADAQLGQRLGVTGTPTFFLNGIMLNSLRPSYFDAAIAWALKKAEGAPPS